MMMNLLNIPFPFCADPALSAGIPYAGAWPFWSDLENDIGDNSVVATCGVVEQEINGNLAPEAFSAD